MTTDEYLLDCIEISHSAFSQTYYKCRNCDEDGVTVEGQLYDYYPMGLSDLADSNNLDMGFKIDFGDLGEVLPMETDNVKRRGEVDESEGMLEKPVVIYRGYKNTDLTSPLIGPLYLTVTTISHDPTGASFEAAAPYLNNTKTGETYNPTRFPMLYGFLV